MQHHNKTFNEIESRIQMLEMAIDSLERRAPELRAIHTRVERNRQRIEMGLEPIYE